MQMLSIIWQIQLLVTAHIHLISTLEILPVYLFKSVKLFFVFYLNPKILGQIGSPYSMLQ